jgi:hypothetical protein
MPLTDEDYNEMLKTLKDRGKLKWAVQATECHSEYGVAVLIQRTVNLFALRAGKPIIPLHLDSLF